MWTRQCQKKERTHHREYERPGMGTAASNAARSSFEDPYQDELHTFLKPCSASEVIHTWTRTFRAPMCFPPTFESVPGTRSLRRTQTSAIFKTIGLIDNGPGREDPRAASLIDVEEGNSSCLAVTRPRLEQPLHSGLQSLSRHLTGKLLDRYTRH